MPHRFQFRPNGVFVGLATIDVLYSVDQIPGPDEKISAPAQFVCAGGPATNAAATFAFLGGHAELVTAVGAHPAASIIRNDLREHSVHLRDLARRRPELPPISSIMVLRETGERTVVSANAAVFSDVSSDFDPEWLRDASILLVDGHYLPLCVGAARLARERGITVVMDSGSWKDGMAELLPLVDIAICSDDYRPPGCRDSKDVFHYLRAQNIRQVAITAGPAHIRLVDYGRRSRIAIEMVPPADTLGAGDIFHGAFCSYICQPGMTFREALTRAAHVASFSCRYPGTRLWMKAFRS
jgi:sugar/nucleoside kinase (ribokinase family)